MKIKRLSEAKAQREFGKGAKTGLKRLTNGASHGCHDAIRYDTVSRWYWNWKPKRFERKTATTALATSIFKVIAIKLNKFVTWNSSEF